MNKYDSYKDSGIEWIGEIPSHWKAKKIKHLLEKKKGALKTGPFGSHLKTTDLVSNGEYKVYTQRNVLDNDFESGEDRIDEEKFLTLKEFLVEDGDILFTSRGTIGKCNIVPSNSKRGVLHPCLIRIQTDENLVIRKWILKYANESSYFLENVKYESNSTIIDVIYGGTLKEIFVPLPPLPEQTAIATYLDRKTAEIDELIADKKRLLELYEEEKTALINQAVTKGLPAEACLPGQRQRQASAQAGLSPDVPMKDSGIEWLGEIPEHWEVQRLSRCFGLIGSGTTPKAGSKEYYHNGEINWLLTGDLNDGEICETSKKVTHKALEDHSSLKIYPKNSVVMAMYGATIGKLGILKISTTVNQACCVMAKPIQLNHLFAFYVLLAARIEIINMSYGGGQPNISQELIKSFRIQTPPIEEQQSIVRHIETESIRIDAKISKTEKLIDLLTEYRTALISEVITGKIKVV